MFGNRKAWNSAAKLNLTEETVSVQSNSVQTDELGQYPAYKRMEWMMDNLRMSVLVSIGSQCSWLLLWESCLELKTEMKDKQRWHLMTCSICEEFQGPNDLVFCQWASPYGLWDSN